MKEFLSLTSINKRHEISALPLSRSGPRECHSFSGAFCPFARLRETQQPLSLSPSLSQLPGYSLTCCRCTFIYILNNGCAIKHAGDTEVAYLPQELFFFPPFLLLLGSGVRAPAHLTSCRAACEACKPVYGGMRCAGHVFPRVQIPSLLLLWSANTQGPDRPSPCSWPGLSRRVGARLTVAHKRISPPHKDSGPLLSLTRSTKEMTFVCLGGRRGCVRTVRPGGVGGGGGSGGGTGIGWGGGYTDRRGG